MTTLAQRLWQARLDGTTVARPTVDGPRDDAAAYAIQRETIALSGHPVVGFKVGSTSAEAMKHLGSAGPGAGPLMAPFVHVGPATIRVHAAHHPMVEGEFAVRLGRNLPARQAEYGFAEVADAVEAVAAAIEIVGSRFAGGLDGLGRLLATADCSANIGLALGPWQTGWRPVDLAAHSIVMRINGVERDRGTGARSLGHPLNVVQWLANRLSADGRGLRAGEIVSTGTCTGVIAVAPGDMATVDLGTLGSVAVTFT